MHKYMSKTYENPNSGISINLNTLGTEYLNRLRTEYLNRLGTEYLCRYFNRLVTE